MKVTEIVKLVNHSLAGERLAYGELIPCLNNVIDEINTMLNAVYPVFTTDMTTADYDYFPDRFIRSVVVPGAVFYFYTIDEEGAQTAPMFQFTYKQNLFYMLRDLSAYIPEIYQGTNTGSIQSDFEEDRGLIVYGNDFGI